MSSDRRSGESRWSAATATESPCYNVASPPAHPAIHDPALRQLLDRAEITDRVSDLALGLDLLERDRYRRCFADRVEIRNPHFAGTAAVRHVTGDDWVDSVLATQDGFAVRVHVLSNPAIEIAGDQAEVVLTQQATFGTADGTWYRVAGPLRLHMMRSPAWRITGLCFDVRSTEGDPVLHDRWGSRPGTAAGEGGRAQ